MFNQSSGLPIAGGLLLAIIAYALFALFVTGPIVGERLSEKANWSQICTAQIQAEAAETRSPISNLPKLGCMELFGGWFGKDGAEYCRVHGHHFVNNPINRLAEKLTEKRRAIDDWRMQNAAAKAETRCSCAVTTTLEARRTQFALYTGSLRLIAPPSVKALRNELTSALNSPRCSMKG